MEKKTKWIIGGCAGCAVVFFIVAIAIGVGAYFYLRPSDTDVEFFSDDDEMEVVDSVAVEEVDVPVSSDYGSSGHYTGTMAGFPIELDLNVDEASGTVKGKYHNVKYGTVINLKGNVYPDGTAEMEGDGLYIQLMLNGDTEISGFGKTDGKTLDIELTKQ